MNAEYYISLLYENEIGRFFPHFNYHECQLLSFRKKTNLDFFPPVGADVFFGFYDEMEGKKHDPIDSKIEQVWWSEHHREVGIQMKMVKMGKSNGLHELMEDIAWMKAMGFDWEEEPKEQQP